MCQFNNPLGVSFLENLENMNQDGVPEEVSVVPTEMPELESVREPEIAEEPVQPGDPTFDEIWNDAFFRSIGIEPEETSDPEVAEEEEMTGAEPESSEEPEEKESWQKNLLMYLHDLAYLLGIIVVVFLLLFRVVVVSGSSMKNTLYDGDYLLLLGNLFYGEPKAGDIIVASKDSFKDGSPIVKRVIATEGQWVYIDFNEGIVYVGDDPHNMQALDEPYALGLTTMDEGTKFPLQVKEDCVFVLGDNRGDSTDSRSPKIGQIDRREIMGKVIFLFLPGESYSGDRDFSRIGAVS
jgi:signal peptidase I